MCKEARSKSRQEGTAFKEQTRVKKSLVQPLAVVGVLLLLFVQFILFRNGENTRNQQLSLPDEDSITNDEVAVGTNSNEGFALIPYKRPIYQEYMIASSQYLFLACTSITEKPFQLVVSIIQPNITELSHDFVVKVQNINNIINNMSLEDVSDKSYCMMSVFLSDWMLLFRYIISCAVALAVSIRSEPILLGLILSAAIAAFILLVVTMTAIGEYCINQDLNSFGKELSVQKESPKTKKTIRYSAEGGEANKKGVEGILSMERVIALSGTVARVSPSNKVITASTIPDDISSEYNSEDNDIGKVVITPIVPFAIDVPGHRTVPIEIQMDYSASKQDKLSHLTIDHQQFYSPSKTSPLNKTALEVNPSRLLSSSESSISTNAERERERERDEALKSFLLKTVESRLTPNKASPSASYISTSRATYIQDTSRTTNPQTLVIPTNVISPIKPFTPPPPVAVSTPPRTAAKMKASTGTQTDKSTLRDGIASSRSSRASINSNGDDHHRSARKIVTVPVELPSTLSKRGAVMAPPKTTPPREIMKSSSGDGTRRKTPSKSSFSSTSSGEDRSSSLIGISPLTSLLTETYDGAIHMNVTPSSNNKRVGNY